MSRFTASILGIVAALLALTSLTFALWTALTWIVFAVILGFDLSANEILLCGTLATIWTAAALRILA